MDAIAEDTGAIESVPLQVIQSRSTTYDGEIQKP